MKTYQFDFNATQRGYGVVCADNVEEAKRKILEGDYEDIIDTYDMEITEITNIEKVEDN
jgi:hypothetical protein